MLLYVEIDKEQNIIATIQSNEEQKKENVHKVPEKYLDSYFMYQKYNPLIEEFYEKIPNTVQYYFKTEAINRTKELLKVWLEQNPIFSKVHNPEGEYYSVSEEKQILLNQEITSANLELSIGGKPDVSWNARGFECEPWTIDELVKLALEIKAYIKPKIKMQQKYEVLINNCSTKEEVEAIEINYDADC